VTERLSSTIARASRDDRLRDALAAYKHTNVLVIDEVGFLTYGSDAA
jgi:hypothetical protein